MTSQLCIESLTLTTLHLTHKIPMQSGRISIVFKIVIRNARRSQMRSATALRASSGRSTVRSDACPSSWRWRSWSSTCSEKRPPSRRTLGYSGKLTVPDDFNRLIYWRGCRSLSVDASCLRLLSSRTIITRRIWLEIEISSKSQKGVA